VSRDHFKCRLCSASVEAGPAAVMEVEGGNELVTICQECRVALIASLRRGDPPG
jgi:hypothetical protein